MWHLPVGPPPDPYPSALWLQPACPSVGVLREVLLGVLLELGDDPFGELMHYMGPLPPLN